MVRLARVALGQGSELGWTSSRTVVVGSAELVEAWLLPFDELRDLSGSPRERPIDQLGVRRCGEELEEVSEGVDHEHDHVRSPLNS